MAPTCLSTRHKTASRFTTSLNGFNGLLQLLCIRIGSETTTLLIISSFFLALFVLDYSALIYLSKSHIHPSFSALHHISIPSILSYLYTRFIVDTVTSSVIWAIPSHILYLSRI